MSNKRSPMEAWEALLRGAAEGATFGFSGELAGIGAQLDEFGKRLGGAVPTDMGQVYARGKGDTQALLQQAEEEHPVAAYGGQLGASLLVPVPGGAAANALARSGQIAKAARIAALGHGAAGALTAIGRAEGTPADSASEVAKDAVVSALAGGGAQRYGPQLAAKLKDSVRGTPWLARRLGRHAEAAGDYAERGAAKAATMAEPSLSIEHAKAVEEEPRTPVDFYVVRNPETGRRIIMVRQQ